MVQEPLAIRQFRQDDCLSYIVFDRSSLQAMVVDPRLDLLNDYREFLSQSGCRVMYTVDTRVHADHLSAAHLFSSAVVASAQVSSAQVPSAKGCEHMMSSQTSSQRPSRKLGDGEKFLLGAHAIHAIHASATTNDGLILKSDQWLLTGDSLWIGNCENALLPQANVQAIWNLARKLSTEFADDLLVYPGHDRMGILFSTLGVEKKRNPLFQAPSVQSLQESLAELRSTRPDRYDQESLDRMHYNQMGSQNENDVPLVRPGSFGTRRYAEYGASKISVEKFKKKLEEHASGTEFIDVREPDEFRAGHMPGMRNLALSDLGADLPRLISAKRVYISCLSGLRSALAARTLAYLGVRDVVVVSGGFQAWNQVGYPVTDDQMKSS
jgi:rhodanese-related sulfurtransferase/glyoxylase-like metal-dependent hydrolase (beta-lactamase superfamily II)